MLCFACNFQDLPDVPTLTYSFIYSHTERVFLLTFEWDHPIYKYTITLGGKKKKKPTIYCGHSIRPVHFYLNKYKFILWLHSSYTYLCLHWCLCFCGKGSQTCGFWVKRYVMCNSCSFYQKGGGGLAQP